jgi:hypothetical protein
VDAREESMAIAGSRNSSIMGSKVVCYSSILTWRNPAASVHEGVHVNTKACRETGRTVAALVKSLGTLHQ